MNTAPPTHPIPARIKDRTLAALKASLPPVKIVDKPVPAPTYSNPAQIRINAILADSLKISVPILP